MIPLVTVSEEGQAQHRIPRHQLTGSVVFSVGYAWLKLHPSPIDRGSMAQSGCQAFSGEGSVGITHTKSRVVCEYNPNQVVHSI